MFAPRAVSSRGRAWTIAARKGGSSLMIDARAITAHMPVVCSEGEQFAVVDHLEGPDAIELARDASGQHHFIPLRWVTSVDDRVHVDRPAAQAMREWSMSPAIEGHASEWAALADPLHVERVRSQQTAIRPGLEPEGAEQPRKT